MSVEQSDILDLIERVYAASTDPAEFRGFMAKLAALMRSPVSSLIIRDSFDPGVAVAYATELDPEYQRLYEEHFHRVNIWFPNGKAPEYNQAKAGSQLVVEADFLRSEYFNDFLRPQALFYMAGASVKPGNQRTLSLSTLRSRAAGDFNGHELAVIQRLVPHLQRAMDIHRRLEDSKLLKTGAWQALDTCGVSLVLVDNQQRIRGASEAGEQTLKEGTCLVVRNGRLATQNPRHERSLAALIDSCFRPVDVSKTQGGVLAIERPAEGRPLTISVDPLPSAAFPWRPALAVLIIRDPERSLETSALLQATYGLTPAESRLTGFLTQGSSLQEISEKLGVTLHTLRSQLKNVFQKTNTQRQAELVSLVLRTSGLGMGRS